MRRQRGWSVTRTVPVLSMVQKRGGVNRDLGPAVLVSTYKRLNLVRMRKSDPLPSPRRRGNHVSTTKPFLVGCPDDVTQVDIRETLGDWVYTSVSGVEFRVESGSYVEFRIVPGETPMIRIRT